MKKLICLALSIVMLCSLSACSGNAPELNEVRDELVSLIESSYEINEILFGEGLPTYERGGEYDKEHFLYSPSDTEFAYYEYVTEDCGYFFTDRIKSAAEEVYTAEYLAGVYTMAFDGYADENTGKVTPPDTLTPTAGLCSTPLAKRTPSISLTVKKDAMILTAWR